MACASATRIVAAIAEPHELGLDQPGHDVFATTTISGLIPSGVGWYPLAFDLGPVQLAHGELELLEVVVEPISAFASLAERKPGFPDRRSGSRGNEWLMQCVNSSVSFDLHGAGGREP